MLHGNDPPARHQAGRHRNFRSQPGVAGKGLLRLQESGVAIELFRPDPAQKIRTINAAFVRCQQNLGGTIISPKPVLS
jgi:hypothetical protein